MVKSTSQSKSQEPVVRDEDRVRSQVKGQSKELSQSSELESVAGVRYRIRDLEQGERAAIRNTVELRSQVRRQGPISLPATDSPIAQTTFCASFWIK